MDIDILRDKPCKKYNEPMHMYKRPKYITALHVLVVIQSLLLTVPGN